MKKVEIITSSDEKTLALGKNLGEKLIGGEKIALIGDLGAGKTTFTKGLLTGYGINGGFSPSFIVDAVYQVKNKPPLHHLDLYRIKDSSELLTLGLNELLESDDILVVEWENLFPFLPKNNSLTIEIEHLNENKRRFLIKATGKHEKYFNIFNNF